MTSKRKVVHTVFEPSDLRDLQEFWSDLRVRLETHCEVRASLDRLESGYFRVLFFKSTKFP